MVQEFLGTFGAFCLALCAAPQALKTIRTRSAGDLSWWFLTLWLLGEIAFFIYNILYLDNDLYLNINYISNIIFIFVIFKYKMGPGPS